MSQEQPQGQVSWTERLAHWTTTWVGSSWAFIVAGCLTLLWLVSGPIFRYSDSWQLVMNTISSIVTFLMVFLLQRSQNKDTLAMQIKLNEILGTIRGASNRLINVEDLPEEEVRALHERYQQLSKRGTAKGNVTGVLSIEQAGKPTQRTEQQTVQRADGGRAPSTNPTRQRG
jgi:low affinity Fe/Cu permease